MLGLGGIAIVNPLRTVSKFPKTLWVSWMQSQLALKLDILESQHSGRSLTRWGVRWRVQISDSSEAVGSWEFHPGCVDCARGGGLWWSCVSASYPLQCRIFFFLICLIYKSSASFWISFKGNCSVCSCRFDVSLGSGEFRKLLCHRLEPELLLLLICISLMI